MIAKGNAEIYVSTDIEADGPIPFRDTAKRHMPKRWFDAHRHMHVALDDAIEQGSLFCNMLTENRARRVGEM